MTTIRFHFEDRGQDFTWWDIDEESGEVVDCGPFQASIWANGRHYVNLSQPHGVGDLLTTTDDIERSIKTGYSRTLNCPVERIEQRAPA